MLGSLARIAVAHRIFTSRAFAVVFFLAILLTGSAEEGSLFSTTLFLAGLVLVGAATVGRLWCSLYISGYKDSELITTGPYSMSRNPLYFFSFLGFVGVGLATETVTLGVVLGFIFLIGYRFVIEHEESKLSLRFGAEYADYCARTPRFFPDFSKFTEPATYLVNPALFRRTMGDVVWFVWLVGIVELVEALHEYGFFRPLLLLP
jgi:protein-S-isoprenylcysteine O-methyltransferase Ste14